MRGGGKTNRPVKKPLLEYAWKLMGTKAALAAAIPVSRSYISRLLYSDIPVSQFVANRIEELTKGEIKAKNIRPHWGKKDKWKKGERIRDRLTLKDYQQRLMNGIEHTAAIINEEKE